MNIEIIYEDAQIIVVNKPSNLLTIANLKNKTDNLYHYLSLYVKQKNKMNKVFIVHRLDFQTSGLIVFAKSFKVKEELQKLFETGQVIRKYQAITTNKPPKETDVLINYLVIDKFGNVFNSTKNHPNAKKAITKYKFIKKVKEGYLLDIEIITGRKNQIRIALANINCPIVNDSKYSKQKGKRMYLRSYLLDITKFNKDYLFKINGFY